MKFKRIDEVSLINDKSITSKMKFDFINYLDTGNITNGKIDEIQFLKDNKYPSRAKRLVKSNDIVFSTVRPNQCHFGILKNLVPNMVVSTGFTVLTATEEIDADYLYYFLTLPDIIQKLQSIAETSTSTYPSIKPSDIGNLIVPLPNINTQKKVGAVLASISNKIEVNNQINKNLQSISQLLFKQWFVDFEFPNEEGLPYKSSGGEMVESELGIIPKGWKVGTLNEIGIFKNGKGIKEVLRTEKGNYYIFGSNGIIGKTNEILQQEPSIIVGRVGAYCGSIQLTLKPCWVTDNAIIALPIEKKYLPYLYLNLLNSSLREKAGGSAQPLINQSILNNIKVVLSESSLIEKYSDLVFTFLQKIESNNEQNLNLANLRDILLPKLMNGEIDLGSLELN